MLLPLPSMLVIVFLINVIPAFMPPTWVFLAYVYVTEGGNPAVLAVAGAVFSTMGRIVLMKWFGPLVYRFLGKPMKKNVEYAEAEFDKRPLAEFLFSFVYALGPLPSNTLFIISGAAKLRFLTIVGGFFLGRVISYFSLMYAANFTFETIFEHLSFSSPYVLASGLVGLLLAGAFFFVDWGKLLRPKRR